MSSRSLTSPALADPRPVASDATFAPERPSRGEALDRFAEPHLSAWRRGILDDDTLRRNLAELIAGSDVPSVVARRLCTCSGRGYDARLHADLTEKLRTLLVDKMLPPSTAFDPGRASSIRGWAWNLASSAAVYQRRDLRRFYARFQLLAHDTDLTIVGGSPEASPPPPRTDSWDVDTCSDVADAVQALAKPDRELVHLRAEALLAGLGLPTLHRIPDLADRERVTALLDTDPVVALRSLDVWLAPTAPVAERVDPVAPVTVWVDPALLSVWDQFTAEQATRLLSCAGSRARREQVAHTVAMAAACPLPRPALKRIRTFVSAVVAAAKDGDEPARGPGRVRDEAVREVAAAFVETQCEPVARRATMHVDVPGVLERHRRLKDSFERHLAAVAALDSDLGDCPGEVRDGLHRIAKEQGLLFGSPLRASLQALNAQGPR